MSAEATTIRTLRSSTVVTGVLYTNDFRWRQKKKFKELRSGKRGDRVIGPPRPTHHLGYVVWKLVTHHNRKMCWCAIVHEPHFLVHSFDTPCNNSGEMWKILHTCRYLQLYQGTPNPRIPLTSHLKWLNILPTAAYYRDFHRLNVVCDPVFYDYLSSPSCLLSPPPNLSVEFGNNLYNY
ncbi:hypothetical protein TNCV_1817721 [Trichonephila clavipes]|nr:hypothetical protein TNCV_1817721 [Trichonephila clavipes]